MSEPSPSPSPLSIAPAFLLIVVAALVSAFAALWGVQTVASHREAMLVARIDSLRAVLGRGHAGRGGVPGDTTTRAEGGADSTGGDLFDESDLTDLRSAGLSDPVAQLATDLMRHPELIPFDGRHGALAFHDPHGIHPLGGHWVFARFDDGLVSGSGIFEYQIRGGRIEWKRIAARMD